VRISIRFPLGVYHAQSQASFDEPEWPPHPVRLIAALLAAAHSPGRHQRQGLLEQDLSLLKKLCDASPPLIGAPHTTRIGGHAAEDVVVPVIGATRWAPANYFKDGKRNPASVHKVGVAVGDRPIHFEWPELELELRDLQRLARLAGDVSFLGTTRSPVVAEVASEAGGALNPVWTPVAPGRAPVAPTVAVRVPDVYTLDALDRRHAARRSTKAGVETATAAVPGIRVGREAAYLHSSGLALGADTVDPRWWGEMVVLSINRERSEVIPRSSACYLLARAVRTALLSAYEDAGKAGEAPAILHGRGDEAHCAIVPLADVWHKDSSGSIKGVAILFPSVDRGNDLPRQRLALEFGLSSLVQDTGHCPQRYVQIPDSGRIWLAQLGPREATLKTLLRQTYRAVAATWVSVTPVVHARWRKSSRETLLGQVARDCSHVGLPAPTKVETIQGSAFPRAASRPVAGRRVPQEWRQSLAGPSNHLRITFASPIAGPVLLGRARHFGLGLLVPDLAALGRNRPGQDPAAA
jgi:CRISPR-associated protein Csb2